MKKLLLIIIVQSFCYSQEIATTESGKRVQLNSNGTYQVLEDVNVFSLNLSDFNFVNEKYSIKEKIFQIRCIDKKLHEFDLTTFISKNQMEKLSVDKISEMIALSNEKTTYSLKNKYTYSPKSIRLDFQEKDQRWCAWVQYTAQNDYGATKDSYSFVFFNPDGHFINIVNF